MIWQQLEAVMIFSVLAGATHWIAASKGLFAFPEGKPFAGANVSGKQVLGAFLVYLGTCFLIAPFIALFMRKFMAQQIIREPVVMMGFLQFLVLCLAGFLLFLFSLSQDREAMKRLWKNTLSKQASPVWKDFLIGVATWFVSFPLVIVVSQLCDLFITVFVGPLDYEQVAVKYLRTSMVSWDMIFLALFTIMIAAPIIEEILFRGFLLSWIRERWGTAPAILISSAVFALFHLAASQGWGNISLAVPLFVFACYLGFIYVRQGSLFASIGLHMTFNTISSYRILFNPE